jgi:hypothetical protein
MPTPYLDLIDDVKKLNLDIARRIIVPIYSTMTVAGMVPATYKVPNGFRFSVMTMRGHLVIPYATTPTVDMAVLYAMNCRLKILDQDTPLNLTENSATYLALSDILPMTGGKPIEYGERFPWIVAANNTIRVEPTLVATPAASGEYGVVVEGVLVHV